MRHHQEEAAAHLDHGLLDDVAVEHLRRARGDAHQAGGDRGQLVGVVARQVVGDRHQQPVGGHHDGVRDAGHPLGERAHQPAQIPRVLTQSVITAAPPSPRRWSAVVRTLLGLGPPDAAVEPGQRAAHGVRIRLVERGAHARPALGGIASSAGNCAMGTRTGSPRAVTPPVMGTSGGAGVGRELRRRARRRSPCLPRPPGAALTASPRWCSARTAAPGRLGAHRLGAQMVAGLRRVAPAGAADSWTCDR